jgi:hypothetical protein
MPSQQIPPGIPDEIREQSIIEGVYDSLISFLKAMRCGPSTDPAAAAKFVEFEAEFTERKKKELASK